MKKYQVDSTLSPQEFAGLVAETLEAKGSQERAVQQQAYMRHQFAYYGLTAPQWLAISRELFEQHGTFTGKKLEQFIVHCYASEYREMHYIGIEMMQKRLHEQSESWIRVFETCIQTASWWDSVDWLAKLTGMHFKRFPHLQEPYASKWIESDHIWLQRVAIIHQLLWKHDTDVSLLFRMIRRRADSKEFFIQKAGGWALRQHAKTDPQAVQKFLSTCKLSSLTIREANKQLNKPLHT